MNWLVTSALTSLLVSSGPLILVESARRATGTDAIAAHERKRTYIATAAVWIAFALWFVLDSAAIAAGQRPVHIAAVLLTAFLVLLVGFAFPAMRALGASSGPVATPNASHAGSPSPSALRRAHLVVAAVIVVVALAYTTAQSDVGHQVKAGVIVIGAIGLYGLEISALRQGRPTRSAFGTSSLTRAIVVFTAFVCSALLTLLLDWSVPWQSWAGVASQWAVGVVGFIQCAGLLLMPAQSSK